MLPSSDPFAFVSIDRVGMPFVEKGLAVPIRPVAPGFFTVFQDFAAATAVRVNPDGSQTQLPVTTCYLLDCEMNPIDVSSGTVYLSLYGTGFAQALAEYTSCTVAGKAVEVTYAGPEMAIAGLDQLNLLLPASLAGSGVSTVACLVGFSQSTFFTAAVTSNPVKVTIR